jgi:hypothetical protein
LADIGRNLRRKPQYDLAVVKVIHRCPAAPGLLLPNTILGYGDYSD